MKFCHEGCHCKKTPADRLADVAEEILNRPTFAAPKRLRDALDDYRSTRNGVGQTMDAALGSPPDPVKVARLLLDSLTGGALSSLICDVRDHIVGDKRLTTEWLDNIRANLRALGEKIE